MESDDPAGAVCPRCQGSGIRQLGCSGCGLSFIPCECCGAAECNARSNRLFVAQMVIVCPVALCIVLLGLAL